jgi:hypothetical protein
MILLGHISDLHLDRTDNASERARHVMDYLSALPRTVDALLALPSGASRHGSGCFTASVVSRHQDGANSGAVGSRPCRFDVGQR